MSDPITGAIASAVANHAVGQIRELIDTADDPEKVWKEALYELSIKIETSYQQNCETGELDEDQFSRELTQYGRMARELALRGDIRGFSHEGVELVERVADLSEDIQGAKRLSRKSMEGEYSRSGLDKTVSDITDKFGPRA